MSLPQEETERNLSLKPKEEKGIIPIVAKGNKIYILI